MFFFFFLNKERCYNAGMIGSEKSFEKRT